LTSITPAHEKRAPAVTGAWGVSRPSLSPTNVNSSLNGSMNGGTAHNSPISRLDEAEGGAERPVGKIGELYNPKSVRQLANGHQRTSSDNKVKDVMSIKNGEVNGNTATPHISRLVGAVSSMSLENGVEPSSTSRVGIEQEPTVAAPSPT